MFKLVILFTFCVTIIYGQEEFIGGRIVNINEVPYQVSISSRNVHSFGGTIIGNNSILTAASILRYNKRNLKVRTGSTLRGINGKVYGIRKKIVHPKYNDDKFTFDFAIFILNESITFSNDTQPAKLPKMDDEVENEDMCQVSGWGTTRQCRTNMFLRVANVTKTTQQYSCRGKPEVYYSNDKICGVLPDGTGPCFADPGSPLTCNGVLQGITSIEECCSVYGFPSVYGRVAYVISWIEETQRKYQKK